MVRKAIRPLWSLKMSKAPSARLARRMATSLLSLISKMKIRELARSKSVLIFYKMIANPRR